MEQFSALLERARAGDSAALGELLETYRNYLRLVARTQMGPGLYLQLSASDLVQETFLEAHRDFPAFAGSTEPELLAWLRQILVRNLIDQAKRERMQGRDRRRQASLDELMAQSHQGLLDALAVGTSSPSEQAVQRERSVHLADALASLPPLDREVIIRRQLEHQRFKEIAAGMGSTEGAVRVRWLRALEKLKRALEKLG